MSIFDTIWRKRGRPSNHEGEKKPPKSQHITMTGRDYSSLLEEGDVAIKFWLPELMGEILDEDCSFAKTSRSDFIRQQLFLYLYGRHDLWGLHEMREQYNYYELHVEPEILYSHGTFGSDKPASPDIKKDMGKNIEDLKVWIPCKMKEDIQALATKADISISEMIREIIVSMLIGHTYLAARKELLQMEIEIEDLST